MTNQATVWTAKDPEERFWLTFDFSAALDAGETIASNTVAISVRSGSDATPTAVLDGAPSLSGASILQRVKDGVDGASYLLRCAATTSADRVLVLGGVLPVRQIR